MARRRGLYPSGAAHARRRRCRRRRDALPAGRPLSAGERDHAISLVRGSSGIAESIDVAVDYVRAAEAACEALLPSEATEALRAAPAALLATVAERV